MAQATITVEGTTYVVRDGDGRVVVAFWGAMAEEEAALWSDVDGYRVEKTDSFER